MRKVAPARERGLKCKHLVKVEIVSGRSREGAWIEIVVYAKEIGGNQSLPRGSVD